MKSLLLACAISAIASIGNAGTLTIKWEGGAQYLVDDPNEGDPPVIYTPFAAEFVFSVAGLDQPDFSFYGEPRRDLGGAFGSDFVTLNPFSATLISRPNGHVGGYDAGFYDIKVNRHTVSVIADLDDSEDYLALRPDSVWDTHNQRYYSYISYGYWSASYVPDQAGDGTAFSVAPVPLPAGGSLLALGLGLVAFVRGRRLIGRSR